MKFRLKHVEGLGWFAQAEQTALRGLLKEWYTIGQHRVGFDLYSENHISHPLETRAEAETLIRKYRVSLIPKQIEYFEVD